MRRSIPLALTAVALLIASPAALATFPGDNGLIAFQAETDDGLQLFTMSPDGSGVTQITHVKPDLGSDSPGASRPDWSPDGRTIVFNENGCTIAFIDPDGGNLRRVEPEGTVESGAIVCETIPAFTPDGRSIVYERCQAETCEIWTMELDGTGRRLITDACGTVAQVSPDGTQLMFKGCSGLMVANMDGTDVRQVTPDLDVAYKHDWAPDGSVLVFVDSADVSPTGVNIATVAPDGTGMRYLTHYAEPDWYTGFGGYSPDGASIIYRLDRGEDEHAVFIMAADGSDVRQITEFSDFSPRAMDWGPSPAE